MAALGKSCPTLTQYSVSLLQLSRNLPGLPQNRLTHTEDLPWIDSMAAQSYAHDHSVQPDSQPPTVAAFSPSTITGSALTSRQRSSIIVHRKSPLLVATPPPITRALAYSHPFLLPLNKLAGLLTWTSGDVWQSFLLLASFWAVVLYSDAIILWAGPVLMVIGLILGMYGRRYSPLSSTALTGEKHQKEPPRSRTAPGTRRVSTRSSRPCAHSPPDATSSWNPSSASPIFFPRSARQRQQPPNRR